MRQKVCFGCKRNLPLFMYQINNSKYIREAELGKVIECRLCTYKRAKLKGGLMARIEGKFTFVPMTKKERIINFFKK